MPTSSAEITELLLCWADGDPQALDRLVPLIYQECKRLAAQQLRRERADHTLDPTALVHELYFRLVDQQRANWQNRAHFLALPRSSCAASWSIMRARG